MGESRSDKLLGPYTDLALLVLGFILTTVVGGFLAYCYQERARVDAERTARLQAELVRATAVSDEVSRMLDRRLYRMRVLVSALKDKEPDAEIQNAREEYRKALADWNENLNRLLSSTEYSFGTELRKKLETRLTERFRSIHRDIDKCVRRAEGCDPVKIEDDINAFNPAIYVFDAQLLERINQGAVGAFRGDHP